MVTAILDQLVQKIDVKIVNQQQKIVLEEQRAAGFCGRINFDPDEYQSYNASVGSP